MATAPSDFHHLEDYARALGLRWEVDETDYDPTNVKVHLIRPSNDHQACMVSDYAMSLQEVVNVLEFLFDAEILNEAVPESSHLDLLERRVEKLERTIGSAVTGVLADDASAKPPLLKELQIRARAIGNKIVHEAEGGYIYYRYRHRVPGISSITYFTVDNAFDPARRHRQSKWMFSSDELKELATWVEADEKILEDYNRTYHIKN